jgi:hypothetical protein
MMGMDIKETRWMDREIGGGVRVRVMLCLITCLDAKEKRYFRIFETLRKCITAMMKVLILRLYTAAKVKRGLEM